MLAGVFFGAFPPELARVSMGDAEPAFFLFAAAGLLLVIVGPAQILAAVRTEERYIVSF